MSESSTAIKSSHSTTKKRTTTTRCDGDGRTTVEEYYSDEKMQPIEKTIWTSERRYIYQLYSSLIDQTRFERIQYITLNKKQPRMTFIHC